MVTLKKLIFLSNKQDKLNDVATLSIEKKSNGIFCKLKYYGTLSGDYILGIKSAENIHKQNVKLGSEEYSFLLPVDIELNNAFGCVLCKNDHGEFTPILWGNEKSENYKSQIVNSLRNNFSKLHQTSIKKTQEKLSDKNTNHNTLFNGDTLSENNNTLKTEQSNITETSIKDIKLTEAHSAHESIYKTSYPLEDIDRTHNEDCTIKSRLQNYVKDIKELSSKGYAMSPFREKENNGKHNYNDTYSQLSINDELYENYANTAYALNTQNFETDEQELNELIDKEMETNTSHDFYNMIADQLDELFEKYPEETNLSKLIDNSKWCKINRDYDNMCYVVGIIYENSDIKYICYGVPGNYNIQPPREMQGYSQWLPTDIADPYNNGYWVMYQDADTGENIFLN